LAKGHPKTIQNGGDIADDATYVFHVFLYISGFSESILMHDPILKSANKFKLMKLWQLQKKIRHFEILTINFHYISLV
jgi:hypothetical protein